MRDVHYCRQFRGPKSGLDFYFPILSGQPDELALQLVIENLCFFA